MLSPQIVGIRACLLKEKGNSHYLYGEYRQAVQLYSRALNELSPYDNPRHTLNDNDHCIVELNQHRVKILNNRAECHRKLKQYDEALRDLNNVIKKSKKQENLWTHMFSHFKKALLSPMFIRRIEHSQHCADSKTT